MDFNFSDEQEQLRDAVRKWVDKGYDFERRRGIVAHGGFSREAYTELAELGLTSNPDIAAITEDHIAYLFEVMRYLIAGDDVEICNLTRQQQFFSRHIQSWVDALCDAIQAHPKAAFYSSLAQLTRAFMAVERQAFDML